MRVLLAFLLACMSFSVAIGFCIYALSQMAEDNRVIEELLIPSTLKLGQLRATQSSIATLIDGIPDDRDLTTEQHLLESLYYTRKKQMDETRKMLEKLTEEKESTVVRAGETFAEELDRVDAMLADDPAELPKIFENKDELNQALVLLGAREHDASRYLLRLEGKLAFFSKTRRQLAQERSLGFQTAIFVSTLFALVLGLALATRMRKLLTPLARLSLRAKRVADGDLSPQHVTFTGDELGALEVSFEHMVRAVREERERAVTNERFAAIGKMAAHVTHEIRNPLSAMSLHLELLEEDAQHDLPQSSLRLVAAVRREVERLEQLSDEYLSLAKLPQPKMESCSLEQIVEEVVLFASPEMERFQCSLKKRIEPNLPNIVIDPAQIRQALINLLRNAREAKATGQEIDVQLSAQGMSLRIDVFDRGDGISEAIRSKVFDPFFSTKGQGTGLGLPITKQIVEAHGGTLLCFPREGGGTCFSILLPLKSEHFR